MTSIKKNFRTGLLVGMNLVLISLLLMSTNGPFTKGAERSYGEDLRGMDPFIGEITMFAGNFAPRGYAFCEGQLLPIAQYPALFSILGTMYGGDGRTTFALPDLRGRVPIHPGNGPGLSNYRLGQKGGAERLYMTAAQMPSHNHAVNVGAMSTASEGGEPNAFAIINSSNPSAVAVGNSGGSQEISLIQPYQTVNYIIALQGKFPSRN